MRKRVLMSSVAATVVASMFMFTGCGSSDNTKEVKASALADKVVATEKPVAKPVSKPVCTKIEGGVVGVQVVGYDDNGNEISRVRSGANGEVCFTTAPASISVIGSGVVDNIKTHCDGSAQAYIQDGTVQCAEIQSAGLIENPDFFRSVLGTVYEAIGIPFKAYDAAILAALAEENITGLLKQLQNFTYFNALNEITKFKDTTWEKNTIEHVVNIYNSKVTDQTKSVVLAVIDGLIKMGPINIKSGAEYLSQSESNETGIIHLVDGKSYDGTVANINAHDTILRSIERFLEAYSEVPGGINIKAVAIRFLNGDFVFTDKSPKTTTSLTVSNKDGSAATGTYIANCIPNKYINCAQGANIFAIDGKNYADAFGGDKFTVNNISSICGPNFIKLDKNGDEVEGYALPATFANSQKYIHLSAAGKALPAAKKYDQIQSYIADTITMDFATVNVDIEEIFSDGHGDNRGNSTADGNNSHTVIASFALEFPDACDNEDASKLEYLTVSYFANYVPVDKNASAGGEGKWKLQPMDNDANVTMLLTARMYDSHTDTYETINKAFGAVVPTYESNGTFNLFEDMNTWMTATGSVSDNKGLQAMPFHMIKEMLVRNFSDAFADDLPTSFNTKMSMMRYHVGPETNPQDVDGVTISVDGKSNNFVDRIVMLSGLGNRTTEQEHYLEMFKSQLNFIGNSGKMDVKGLGMTATTANTKIDEAYKYALKANTQINAIDVKTCLH